MCHVVVDTSSFGRELSYTQFKLLVLRISFIDGEVELIPVEIPDGRKAREIRVTIPDSQASRLTTLPQLTRQSCGSHAQVPANRRDRVEPDGLRAADCAVGAELLDHDLVSRIDSNQIATTIGSKYGTIYLAHFNAEVAYAGSGNSSAVRLVGIQVP